MTGCYCYSQMNPKKLYSDWLDQMYYYCWTQRLGFY